LDCAKNYGCGGANFEETFKYIQAYGLTSMRNYPYWAKV
jgi:hypothetical protein